MLKPRSVHHKVNQECWALLFAALVEGPKSTTQLCEVSGLGRVVVQNIGRCFIKHGLVHVGSWAPDARGVQRLPVWHWGPGEEAPRGKPKSHAELERARRLRRKQQAAGGVAGTVFAQMATTLAQPK